MESLQLAGTLDSLPSVRAYVVRAAALAGLNEHAAYGLRLAVDEIATNTIVHGYEASGQMGDLIVFAVLAEDKLTICLEDTSPPYDPRQTPPPDDLGQDSEKKPAGGLGVYLALQGVDAFCYEYREGRNQHTFVMNRIA